jgi:hypothetical protein
MLMWLLSHCSSHDQKTATSRCWQDARLLLLLHYTHLFLSVPFWFFLLRVACQWFFTALSVLPFSRRAIAAAEQQRYQ